MPSGFKVIIVGGGPVGLTAAHALSRADIDFVLLERRESAIIDAGSNLVIKEEGLRAMSQLELLDALEEVSSSLEHVTRIDHKGRDMGKMEYFQYTKKFFGVFPRVVSRHDLTKVLYDNLPAKDQANIFTSQKVSEIQATPDGVNVMCADGSSYAGSLVIAADGAHSMVRECMRKLALEAGSNEINEEKPFLTTYRCLWMRFPTEPFPEMHPGFTSETHGYKASTQLFVGEKTGVTGIYERIDTPTKERLRFTQADKDAVIAQWGHLPLTKNGKMTLGQVYEQCLQSGLVSLEEGVVDHWSWDGRVVLAGDAAHKFTPSTGAGCNAGITDVVALANELHKLLKGRTGAAVPDKSQVAAALKAYQETRYESVVGGCQIASGATAISTWATTKLKLIDRHVFPLSIIQKRMNKQGAATVAQTPAFTFIKGKERLVGEMPWTHPITA